MPESNIGSGGEIIEELGPDTRKWLEGLITNQTALIIKALTSRPASAPTSNTGGQRANSPAPAGPAPTVFPKYGRNKEGAIRGATTEDLEYYANGARKSLADPEKTRWHAKEQALLDAIEAEIQRQNGPASGGVGGSSADGNGGPDDSEIPFSFIETRIDRA